MNKISELIKSESLFIVTSHVSPDGDNVGSSIGLVKYLRNMGKEAYYVLDDFLPSNLSFLYNNMKIYDSEEVKTVIRDREYLCVALDCGDKKRLKLEPQLIDESKFLVNIDHHESNDHFGDYNYVVKDASSTCELIYHLMHDLDRTYIDKEVATAIYTGLCTDTGSFKYESAGASAFRVAAGLLEYGAEKSKVIRNIYQSDSYPYVKMVSEVMMSLTQEGNIAYMVLQRELLDKYKVDFNDLEELPSHTISVDGVEIGLLFKEKDEKTIKVSFRSKEWANVNEIATFFGGGGHARAAGCTINDTMQAAISMVLNKTREYMNLHGRNSKHT